MPFTIDTSYTLGEVLKSYDPENKLHHIIDVFSDQRPILEEAYWTEANDDTSHEMLRLVSKPTGTYMRLNEGYTKEAVETTPVKEQLAMIGSLFELDKRLADKQRDPGAWRAERTRMHIRGMLENFNRKFWVGSVSTEKKEVDGILTRYNATTDSNVTDCSSWDGDTPSGTYYFPVVVLKWGIDGVQLIYPKGGKTTFVENDRGLVDLLDANSKPYPGYRSYFDFQYGIGVADDRCVQRMVNVDVRKISEDASFEEDLIDTISRLPNLNNAAIYCGRQIMAAIQKRLNAKANLYFTTENVWGRQMPTFQGLPIIRDDSLSIAETTVS